MLTMVNSTSQAMSTAPVHKKQKLASDTDTVLSPSNSCQRQHASAATSVLILEIAAQNGWFRWHDDDRIRWFNDEKFRQNPDYSNLRLVSSEMKSLMDKPECGGPDFDVIVDFLDMRNGFNDDDSAGFCDHCFLNGYLNDGEECDTCKDHYYNECKCKKEHRFGDSVRKLDPRLNQTIEFDKLTSREQASLLLRFLCQVASNFNLEYYAEWNEDFPDLSMDDPDPDLTMIEARMLEGDTVFPTEMKLYNEPFYNFIHHLLFTGWAANDMYGCPGSYTPYRSRFLQDDALSMDWNGGHEDDFHEIWTCFMCLHKSNETPSVPHNPNRENIYTLSQIQYLPETIRRCVENCVDHEARALLGRHIADSIDIYRLVRQTYDLREEELSEIQWQPCFGMAEEDYVPLEDFSGYNPQHERKNIDQTGLLWTTEEIDESVAANLERQRICRLFH